MNSVIITLTLLALFFSCSKEKPHRIGYINPETALGDKSFEPCNENQIFDYYNVNEAGDRTLTYKGGTKAIKTFILSNYHPDKYKNESGYLSLHFVVNCKSESGRFEFVESSLDFEPKKFDAALKKKILQLTMDLKDWEASYLGGRYRDSYAYLTFKLKHGKIIEILP